MTALDPKHLIAPFKNTVHMITIIFTVLLFAVYRLATGGVEVVERRVPQASAPVAAGQPANPAQPAAQQRPQQPAAATKPENVADEMEKLLHGGVAPKDGAQKPKEESSADLNEIERALGITK